MIPAKYSPHDIEAEIFKFWESHQIYKKVRNRGGRKFYFVDGPPYTTGRIHLGTAWNKVIKDTILRFKRMRGFLPTDTPGWDMHGLPIEVKVEQELGFKTKRDIESFGVDKFVEKCMEYALKNKDAMTEQFKMLGVWMDWENPYMTITADYINAAWYSIKTAYERGLLERKKMVVNWCPRCETALADAEVEYWEVEDPSIYVKFPLKNMENTYVVIWTTTPWTLPANIAVAVHPSLEYAKIEAVKDGKVEYYILAKELAESVLPKADCNSWRIVETYLGEDLAGLEYEHPLAEEVPIQKQWKHCIYIADFVTAENTGCVHIAPGHGLEDYELGLIHNLPIFNPVDERGVYTDEAGKYAGIEVRKANDIIIDDLYSKNLLMVEEKIVHRYGHCWRCKTPIIYRATEQWFLKISELKDLMLREIEKVKWIPEWAGSARFRDWVAHAKDWCISRQRYWGIPLPIWVCDNCGKLKVLGSINEIPWKTDLDLHRPRIDEITFSCECGGVMRRIPDVFDVWFDSGVASWGSLGYPLDKSKFEELWPADFITEGHDQTRGWFYSQLGTSVMCFNRAPYKTVLMHGFTLDEQGRKMSKSLGNVVEPEEVIDQIGVDGFRLYVLSSAPWEDLRFSWDEARNVNRLMNIIWNTVRFAYTYMKLDNYKFSDDEVKLKIEDKWILSRLERFSKEALDAMEEYHFHKVVKSFFDFLVEDFSRWYIQIIRSRVWEERDSPSKQAAYFTMFRIIDKSIRIIAPIAPFITEWLYQNFIKLFRSGFESIFLESYPEPDESKIDDELEAHMQIARRIVEASNNARNKAKRKLRWPLRELVVEAKDESIKKAVLELEEIIKSQANVKTVRFVEKFERKVIVKPNYKVIGPLLKDKVNEFVKFIRKMKKIPEIIEFGDLKLKKDEALVFEFEIPENYEFAEFPGGNVYIYTVLDDELIREAYAREIVRRIQEMRKELDLDVEEFIESYIELDSKIVEGWQDYIKNETRSSQLVFGKAEGYVKEWDIIGTKVRMGVRRIN
ncbi:MAG TPA: isoleucine--tRNA ligase [Archaeoglobus sp.]|nr:isoleucine--tRNA ligase [Archaeoglobus sp.]